MQATTEVHDLVGHFWAYESEDASSYILFFI